MTPTEIYAPLRSYVVKCLSADDGCYLKFGVWYRSFADAYRLKGAHERRDGHQVVVEETADE